MIMFAARAAVLVLCLGLAGQVSAQYDLSFQGDAASTRGFMLELAELYASQRRATITIDVSSTAQSVEAVTAAEADMGGSARPQRSELRGDQDVTFFPIAWDALVVITHPNNPLRNLALTQLRDIYSGSTTRWDVVGGDAAAIELFVVDAEHDGVESVLRQMLFRDPQARVPATRTFPDTQSMEAAVEANRHAMAVTTYSAARRLQVKILALEGRAASPDNIQAGEYLLYFPLYLVSREDGRNRRLVREFMRQAQSPNGRRQVRRSGAVPYTDGLALVSRQMERDEVIARALR